MVKSAAKASSTVRKNGSRTIGWWEGQYLRSCSTIVLYCIQSANEHHRGAKSAQIMQVDHAGVRMARVTAD